MPEYTASDVLIHLVAEVLSDGSVRIPEMILRGGQLTMLAKMFEDGCLEFIGDAHVDEYSSRLYIVAAISECENELATD